MKKGKYLALWTITVILLTGACVTGSGKSLLNEGPMQQATAGYGSNAETEKPSKPEVAYTRMPETEVPLVSATEAPTPEPMPTEIPVSEPVILLTGGDSIIVDAGFIFTDPGYTAADYLGNDLTDRVKTEGEVVPYLTGSYEIVYSVTDDLGNTCNKTRKITIQAAKLPEIIMPPEKTVYLTFDDGPSVYTEHLLDVLKEFHASATFFVVGNRIGDGELLQRMQQEGHSIGVHCYNHVYKEIYKSEEAFLADFKRTEERIYETTGIHTRIFRFPGGSGNTASCFNKGIMTRLTRIMEDMGYRYFDWNHSTGDAELRSGKTALDFYRNILTGIHNHSDYAIILQHDINAKSVWAVRDVLKWGMENGYTFRALDITSPVMHAHISN